MADETRNQAVGFHMLAKGDENVETSIAALGGRAEVCSAVEMVHTGSSGSDNPVIHVRNPDGDPEMRASTLTLSKVRQGEILFAVPVEDESILSRGAHFALGLDPGKEKPKTLVLSDAKEMVWKYVPTDLGSAQFMDDVMTRGYTERSLVGASNPSMHPMILDRMEAGALAVRVDHVERMIHSVRPRDQQRAKMAAAIVLRSELLSAILPPSLVSASCNLLDHGEYEDKIRLHQEKASATASAKPSAKPTAGVLSAAHQVAEAENKKRRRLESAASTEEEEEEESVSLLEELEAVLGSALDTVDGLTDPIFSRLMPLDAWKAAYKGETAFREYVLSLWTVPALALVSLVPGPIHRGSEVVEDWSMNKAAHRIPLLLSHGPFSDTFPGHVVEVVDRLVPSTDVPMAGAQSRRSQAIPGIPADLQDPLLTTVRFLFAHRPVWKFSMLAAILNVPKPAIPYAICDIAYHVTSGSFAGALIRRGVNPSRPQVGIWNGREHLLQPFNIGKPLPTTGKRARPGGSVTRLSMLRVGEEGHESLVSGFGAEEFFRGLEWVVEKSGGEEVVAASASAASVVKAFPVERFGGGQIGLCFAGRRLTEGEDVNVQAIDLFESVAFRSQTIDSASPATVDLPMTSLTQWQFSKLPLPEMEDSLRRVLRPCHATAVALSTCMPEEQRVINTLTVIDRLVESIMPGEGGDKKPVRDESKPGNWLSNHAKGALKTAARNYAKYANNACINALQN